MQRFSYFPRFWYAFKFSNSTEHYSNRHVMSTNIEIGKSHLINVGNNALHNMTITCFQEQLRHGENNGTTSSSAIFIELNS